MYLFFFETASWDWRLDGDNRWSGYGMEVEKCEDVYKLGTLQRGWMWIEPNRVAWAHCSLGLGGRGVIKRGGNTVIFISIIYTQTIELPKLCAMY